MTRVAASRAVRRAVPRLCAVALAAVGVPSLAACTPEPVVGAPLAPRRGGAGTWSTLAEQIFIPRCASGSCHGGNPPPAFPEIDAAVGSSGMVNVQSQQDVMMLIAPGDPDQSWLMVRLRGEGGRPYMPLGDAQLTSAELAQVESWIANGAP